MNDRLRLVLWLGITAVAFIAIAFIAGRGAAFDFTRDHSSTRANPWGTKAWRELLERSGVQTQSWLQPLTELGDDEVCLVLLSPVLPVTLEERMALANWVEAGGRLIVAPRGRVATGLSGGLPGSGGMEELLAGFGLRVFRQSRADREVGRLVEDPLTRDVETIHVPGELRLRGLHLPAAVAERTALFGEEEAAAVVRVSFGAGTVIALCEAEMLGNADLREVDNVILAANLVFADGAPRVVHFDEYHNGLAASREVPEPPEVDVGPVRNTALALLGIAALYALGRSRRFGAPSRERDVGVRTADEYVRALAGIYSGARSSGAAAAMLADGLRRRALRAAGLPPGAERVTLERALVRRGLPGREIDRLLDELGAAAERSSGEKQLLTLAQRVARYERML